jgi:class 3 adenylate cyclase/DNA-binding NarL/FixJ family response regulator
MGRLPSGTVTLVFTDVEASTRLVAELPAYPDLLARHRRIVRAAVEDTGGVQVDCRGDEVFAAFTDARAAVEAATRFQRELAADAQLAEAPLRVRAGIHTGRPGIDETSYHGLDVHRAARIASAGHGGQVLVSETSRAAIGDAPIELVDLGSQRLRGLPRPERLYQLRVPGLPAEFPPLRNLEEEHGARGDSENLMRVVVADDSLLLREGVVRMLEESRFDVVGQAADQAELLAEVERSRPDVAITDIRMPPTQTDEGIRAAQAIRDAHPDVGVLVLSQFAEPAYALDLLAGGASGVGYLLKDRVSELLDFAAAVRRVGEGGSALDGEVVHLLVAQARREGRLEGLPRVDVELLELLAEGRSDREIADRLVLEHGEAEERIGKLLARLGVELRRQDRRAAAILAALGDAGT